MTASRSLKSQADNGDQEAAYKYALKCIKQSIFPKYANFNEALYYFILATNGCNWTIAQDALICICKIFTENKDYWNRRKVDTFKILTNEADAGNGFIALYLALSSAPKEALPLLDDIENVNKLLNKLRVLLFESEPLSNKKVLEYLIIAAGSTHQRIRDAAQTFFEFSNASRPSIR